MTTTEKRSHWQRHIDAWQGSELTQKAYCESQGLSVATFGYWRKRLADNMPTKKFISVGTASAPSLVRVHLPGGVLLEVPTSSLAVVLPIAYQAAQASKDA
jgi:hypothetical protein